MTKLISAGHVVGRHGASSPIARPPDKKVGSAWALIHVLEGKLRYCELPPSESILEAGKPGVIEPEVRHYVEPNRTGVLLP